MTPRTPATAGRAADRADHRAPAPSLSESDDGTEHGAGARTTNIDETRTAAAGPAVPAGREHHEETSTMTDQNDDQTPHGLRMMSDGGYEVWATLPDGTRRGVGHTSWTIEEAQQVLDSMLQCTNGDDAELIIDAMLEHRSVKEALQAAVAAIRSPRIHRDLLGRYFVRVIGSGGWTLEGGSWTTRDKAQRALDVMSQCATVEEAMQIATEIGMTVQRAQPGHAASAHTQ